MLRYKLLLFAVVPLISIQPLLGATVQVGTCMANVQSYPTISAAVSSVPAGSTVDVCPGTYAEQVTITVPLTLIGFRVGTADLALITVPAGGLVANTTSMFGESVAAQILVQGAGPVNITNISVDGSGGDLGCISWVAGIFYGSGSSGTISQVRASNQVDSTCGVGIWAENSTSPNQSLNIQDSTVYNADSAGIFAGSGATPTLNVTLNNNVVNASAAVAAIDSDSVTANVSGNDITNSQFGVLDLSGSNVNNNRIIGTPTGIFLGAGGTAANNHVSAANLGVNLGSSGAHVTNNRIMSSATAGVELGCFTATVNGNLINDAPIGVDSAVTNIGGNTFANTPITVSNGCAAAAAFRALTATTGRASTVGVGRANISEWHTPATPFGTRLQSG